MTTATLTEADVRVRDAVMRQLDWDPEVDASAIGVAAKNGTVTLTGFIDSYSGKLAAERAAKRVHGVRAVANDVEVRLRLERTDPDIAQDAARALELRSTIPDGVQVVVHSGHVTLTGKVDWLFQKQSAENAVRHIRGVRGVLNHISVAPRAAVRDVRHRIVKALASERRRGCPSHHGDGLRRYGDLDRRGWNLAATRIRRTRGGECPRYCPGGQPDHRAVLPRLEDGRLGRDLLKARAGSVMTRPVDLSETWASHQPSNRRSVRARLGSRRSIRESSDAACYWKPAPTSRA